MNADPDLVPMVRTAAGCTAFGWVAPDLVAGREAAGWHVATPDEMVHVDVRACRVCGCTDDNACDGGCSWVASDLCSACADPRAAMAMHLVGEIDMSDWEPPTYEELPTGSTWAHQFRCSMCAGTITETKDASKRPVDLARAGHTDWHRGSAEVYARLTNAVAQLGTLPFVTVSNVDDPTSDQIDAMAQRYVDGEPGTSFCGNEAEHDSHIHDGGWCPGAVTPF